MRRSWMICTGGMLAVGLTLGCRHTQPQQEGCTTCGNPPAASQPVGTPPPKLALVPTPPPLVPRPPSLTDDMPVVTVPSREAAAPRALPTIPTAPVAPPAPPAPVAVNPEQSAPPVQPQPAPSPAPVIVQKRVLTERGANPPAVTTVIMPRSKAPELMPTPVSAPVPAATGTATAPPYYNSSDYSILFGVLDFNRRTGVWKLRYADAGDEDRYGGSVTLDGIGRQMQEYASGQTVRVEGGLVDPESHDVSPTYRVKDMRPVTAGK